jgi:glyoxylase-like metal-dependent hydrolase (beta-lactamase superfamily II)
MPLRMGHLEVHAVSDGHIALDGGAMFGVVPRPLWQRHFPADERNRIALELRCMLVLAGDRRVLVDAGAGARWDGRQRELYGLDHRQGSLDAGLARAGLTREDITDVVLTHLHFDHAGGTAREEAGGLELAFPQATYHLQRRHWRWAHHPSEKDAGSFRQDDFALLGSSGRLHLLDGPTELLPGVHLFVTEGHTVGLQLVRLEGGDRTLVFCGDLIPTTAHLRAPWVAAYDLSPLTVIEEKKQLLAQALEEGWVLFLEHDPRVAACTVKDDGNGHVVVDRVLDV